MAEEEVVKNRPVQIVSLTTQVAISREECLAPSSSSESARKQEGAARAVVTDSHSWHRHGARTYDSLDRKSRV